MDGREGDNRTCGASSEHDVSGVYPKRFLVHIQISDGGEKILDSDLLGKQEPVHSLQSARETLADFVVLHSEPVVYRHDGEAVVIEELEPLRREIVLPLSTNEASAKEIYYCRFRDFSRTRNSPFRRTEYVEIKGACVPVSIAINFLPGETLRRREKDGQDGEKCLFHDQG